VIYQVSGVCILTERANIVAVRAPAPTAWIEIFHQKLIMDTIIESTEVAKMNDFRKNGIWNLKIIKDVVQYRIDVVSSGMILSLLSST
jgi:hypothetical protein